MNRENHESEDNSAFQLELTPKIVTMPDKILMLEQLREAEILGKSRELDALLNKFADQVAGTRKAAEDLNLAWELAGYDTLKDVSATLPIMGAIFMMEFDRVIDVVTPDPEVAARAKEIRRKVLEQVAAQREREKQPPVTDQSSDFDLYVATRRVADIVFEVAHQISTDHSKLWIDDRRNQGVNPYYNQTQTGLFLDFYYATPSSIWTPWGEYNFKGSAIYNSGAEEELVQGVMQRLTTALHRPKIYNTMGEIGPTYAILAVEDTELPAPVLRPINAYLPDEEADRIWDDFTKRYKAELNK